MTPRGLRRWAFMGLAVTALVASPLDAQRPGGRGRPDRAALEQRIRARMGEMMRTRLGLTEEQGADLAEIVLRFEGRRRELSRQERALRRRIEALMLEGGEDDQEAEELLARRLELREGELRLSTDEQAALREVLSPTQLLGFHVLREEMGARIRRLRGGADGRRGRGRSHGGGGLDPWSSGGTMAHLGGSPSSS